MLNLPLQEEALKKKGRPFRSGPFSNFNQTPPYQAPISLASAWLIGW